MDKKVAEAALYQNLKEMLDKLTGKDIKVVEFAEEYFVYIKVPKLYKYQAKEFIGEMGLEYYRYDMGWCPEDDKVFAGVLGDVCEEFFDLDPETEQKIRELIQDGLREEG